ncbi:MAG: glycine betaine ABC transporter substrate-binding protein, partial [Thermodesulfobacteriota bacterium]
MQPDLAAQMQISQIGDLATQANKIRMGCEEEFLARPVDGFQPLMRHYGFSQKLEVVVADSREKLYRDLVAGGTDVCVVQRTDPQIQEFGLMVLEDNLDFFPAYQGVPLVREETLSRFPELREVINRLSGKVNDQVMRELNREVELDGLEIQAVATRFLVDRDLITQKPPELKHRRLVVGIPPSGHRSRILAKSLDAVRRVFPKRRVEVETFPFPKEALLNGKAFLALLGAESFFVVQPGLLPKTREYMEAIAVAGFQMAHLIRRKNDLREKPFAGIRRLGIGPAEGSAEQAAAVLLDAYGRTEKTKVVSGDVSEQIKKVINGHLDGMLFMAAPGDAKMILLLEDPKLSLQPIFDWKQEDRQYRYPFFRLARIPEGTYSGMKTALETVGAQVVLTGPRPDAPTLGDGDPVSGLRVQRQPIPRGIKQALVNALGDKEVIDPTLPGERVSMVTAHRDVLSLNPSPGISAITALFLLALGGFFYVLLRKKGTSQD